MTELTSSPELHSKVFEELAWYENGTLSPSDRERVEQHVGGCAECARELQFLGELRAHVGRDEPLLISPERSLETVRGRIDALRAAERGWLRWSDLARIARAKLPTAAWPALLRPVLIAAIWIAVVIGGLIVIYDPTAEFRTLSSSATPIDPAASYTRVVFDRASTAEQIQTLLNELGADIVAGPSKYGVYTVRLAQPEIDHQAALRALREHPGVRFAEPVGPQ